MSPTINLELNLDTLPYRIREGIEKYIRIGRPTGSFLAAVISNDLKTAVFKADDYNLPRLNDIIRFFHNQAPHACWGSEKKMNEWIKIRGWIGYSKTIEPSGIRPNGITADERIKSP